MKNYYKEKLTGGERAASRIELIPSSGDCRSPRRFKTTNARWEIQEGTSRIRLVFTAPGSAALSNDNKINSERQIIREKENH